MARSSTIYAVFSSEGKPLAAFTVKHELWTWANTWRRDFAKYPDQQPTIWRIPDGNNLDNRPITNITREVFG